MFYFSTYQSPLGNINIYVEDDYLIEVEIYQPNTNPLYKKAETPLIREVKKQLDEYFSHRRKQFDLPIKFNGTPFQLRVWQELAKIPYGETISYKELASRIGSPKACRAVGGANNKNKIGIIIPCHRVIGADGSLVGYAGGVHLKQQLLAIEKKQ